MAEPLIVQSLKDKRAEIHGRIAAYQAQIAQAKHDLAHINASIRLFTDPDHQRARYMVSHGFFKKGEIADICLRHLEIDGEMTTRDLAERVMIERKLDATDTTLRNSVVFKVVQALRHAARRQLVRMVENRKGMCHWAAGDTITFSRSTPGRDGGPPNKQTYTGKVGADTIEFTRDGGRGHDDHRRDRRSTHQID